MKYVGFYTLGCKVSQYETEAVAEEFARRGFGIREFDEPCDVYVINTCTVTAESDRKCRQVIRRAIRSNPSAKVLVCGCYSQRTPEELEKIRGVSAVIGSADKLKLADIAERLISGLAPFDDREGMTRVTNIDDEPFEKMCITKAPRTRVYVKIEDGCECKCSYCAIPSARGKVRSKPRAEVIEEVKALSESGVYEIVLTGIETGSYGVDFDMKYSLADLLSEIDSLGIAKRIRLGSLAPELIGREFCDKVKGLKSLAPHFHISIQSGSDNVLRAMKRRYNRKTALENIKRLRESIPGAEFTTDLMVGFPGESEEDFLDTVRFAEEAEFLDCHVFAYSRRKNTPADLYENQIPEPIKKERSERLIEACRQIRSRVLARIIDKGEALSCVLETKKDGGYTGHSDSFAEVFAECEESLECADLRGAVRYVLPLYQNDGIIFGKILP